MNLDFLVVEVVVGLMDKLARQVARAAVVVAVMLIAAVGAVDLVAVAAVAGTTLVGLGQAGLEVAVVDAPQDHPETAGMVVVGVLVTVVRMERAAPVQ